MNTDARALPIRGSGTKDQFPPDRLDRALVERIADHRCPDALEELYALYQPRVVGFLRRLTDDDGLVEDVYNDVMFKVWNKAHQFAGKSKVSTWVFSIAYRACVRALKKERFREEIRETFSRWISLQEPAVNERAEQADTLDQAISALSVNHRLVIELCYFGGYSTEEVSEIVGCPANTVKTRLFHARKKIRDFLEPLETADGRARG